MTAEPPSVTPGPAASDAAPDRDAERSPAPGLPAPALLDALQSAVFCLDGERRLCACNAAGEQLLGHSRRQLLGTPLARWIAPAPELDALLQRAGDQQRPLHGEPFLLHVLPRRPHWLEVSVTPLADGLLVLECQLRDDSQRLAEEAARARQQAELHQLMQRLAHEIKNPLAGVRGATQLLARSLREAGERECTDLILREVDRLRALTDRILLPVRARERVSTNLHAVLEQALQVIEAELAGSTAIKPRLRRDYDPSLPDIPAQPDALQQVFLNLLQNAVDAARAATGRPEVRVRTRAEHGVPVAGRRVRLALRVDVIDNGPGVDPQLAESLFLPLVSDKPGGSGLGLAIVQSIVQQHQGLVEMSRNGGETLFTVWLPVPEPASAATHSDHGGQA